MNTILKNCSIIFFLSLLTSLKGQVFTFIDSIPTTISTISYKFLPVQSDNSFNFLFYSVKNKKQDFELLTLKDTAISRIPIKNKKLDGGGSWYQSAFISDNKLLLLHVDGYLVVYEKNKKGNFVFKKTLTIKGEKYNIVSLLDNETVLLANSYNGYTEKKLYNDYVLCTYNLKTKELYHIEMDLGKGILLSHFATTFLIESKKDKIALAHPTLPFIYIYNDKLEPIDTVYVQFKDSISVDSVINAVFSDDFIKLNRTRPKEIIQTIEDKKIDQLERIEKIFWLSDDVLGYTIRQPLSKERMFVFYSISEKKELYRGIDTYVYSGIPMCTNFTSSTRVLINNNKTVWYGRIYNEDKSEMYYKFNIYDLLLFSNGTE